MRHAGIALLLLAFPLGAQWTNRYPRNAGFGHQVYLEGYELPILASGPGDPAPSPDGRSVAITHGGWLWRLDLASGTAQRLTNAGGVDARPAWSPDGRSLVFVRDDGRTLAVMLRDLATGAERELDRGMAMDPVFTRDGAAVVYTNVEPGGDLDLRRIELASGARTRLTTEAGLELRPQLFAGGDRMVYTSKTRAGGDQVRLRTDGRDVALLTGSIVSQARPALSPDGTLLAYNWPGSFGWELRLMSIDRPGPSVLLHAKPRGRPLTPAWSPDGGSIYFTEGDARQQLHLYRVARGGGPVQEIPVRTWSYGVPTGKLLLATAGPARLHVADASGHPLIPDVGMVRFDGQNGRPFFYGAGSIELEVPAGEVRVTATRGLASVPALATGVVRAGETTRLVAAPQRLWEPQGAGWFSGDHHFHLNYGGQFDLAPQDLVLPMMGEDLDVGTPMLANLHNRYENQDQWNWSSLGARPMIAFAQEVRSHFLGHVGLINTRDLVWPWTWGPGYESYGRDDRSNAEPLAAGRAQGGMGIYVHPVAGQSAPFADNALASIPIGLVPDAVMGAFDLLELVCLWSNTVGTTELWYRLLNAGLDIMPSGGTDVMTDLHRTMALGSTRVYVRPQGAMTWASYLAALKAGRSFVTTGPLLEFSANGAGPGEVIAAGGNVDVRLTVHSSMPVDSIAIVVNGRTVATEPAPKAPFSRSFRRTVRVPSGGWVAARVVGPAVDQWPAMANMTFAHTAPVWIGSRLSTDPDARRAAVADLRRAMANGEQRLDAGYAGTPIPNLKAHFEAARTRLDALAR
ncbi:MAG: CehA/McbA family metallohydrolase [Gemmatimonadetes bacterium]|nr:CehA/McbA family metallohydrolase [Gemmatimonadota bacterium]